MLFHIRLEHKHSQKAEAEGAWEQEALHVETPLCFLRHSSKKHSLYCPLLVW